VGDGPRIEKQEDDKVKKTRELFKNITWECEVKTLFREENWGCKKSVSDGINWFFSHVERGIILEDDCVPDASFFPFCETLLERYKHSEQIMQIGGATPVAPIHQNQKESYNFYPFYIITGWATWRRAWNKIDLEIQNVESLQKDDYFHQILPSRLVRKYIIDKFHKVKEGKISSWAYPWLYTIFKDRGLTIVPKHNLVENIGWGEDATHTQTSNGLSIFNKSQEISFPLIHPNHIEITTPKENLNFFYNRHKNRKALLLTQWLPQTLLDKMRRIS
ncbi:MAG: nucleotide-diphospho-sugar transferase, partial [Saprospiraceae bacterium]